MTSVCAFFSFSASYNALARNCNTFSQRFIERLLELPTGEGEKLMPAYVSRVVKAAQKVRPCLPNMLTMDLRDQLPPTVRHRHDGAKGEGMTVPQRNYAVGENGSQTSRGGPSASPTNETASTGNAEKSKQKILEERRRVAARLKKQQEKLAQSMARMQANGNTQLSSSVTMSGSMTARPAQRREMESSSSSSSSDSSTDSDGEDPPSAKDTSASNLLRRSLGVTTAGSMTARPSISKRSRRRPASPPSSSTAKNELQSIPSSEYEQLGTYIPFDAAAASQRQRDQDGRSSFSRSGTISHSSLGDATPRVHHRTGSSNMAKPDIYSTYLPSQTSTDVREQARIDADRRRAIEAERARHWRTPEELAREKQNDELLQAQVAQRQSIAVTRHDGTASGAMTPRQASSLQRQGSLQTLAASLANLAPPQQPTPDRTLSRRGSITNLNTGNGIMVNASSSGSSLSSISPRQTPLSPRPNVPTDLLRRDASLTNPFASPTGTVLGVSSPAVQAHNGSQTARPNFTRPSTLNRTSSGVPLINDGSQTARVRY